MRKLLPLFILFNILTLSISAEEILRGKQANEAVEGAELVRFKDFSSIPAYIKFRTNERIAFQSWQTWFSSRYLKNASNVDFMLIGEEEDRMGMIHYRYQQRVEGYPMTFGIWIVHTLNGEVVSMNGEVFDKPGSHSPSLSEANALEFALDKINASIYKWELPEEETWLKIEQADQNATYFPKGELEVINSDASLKKLDLHLAWKFNIYAAEPLSRTEIYVDANDGSVIFEQDLIHHADSNGIANTGYSGQQNIVADYTGTNFRLRESGRGNGVHTFDMNNGTNHGAATDVFDNDNVWNATTVERFATDAHWGAEMTYDYYFNYFNRNSIDGNGFLLRSYVHYGNNYANAFWDGQRMTYGDGNNGNSAFTALDIAGHEVTHGLTTFTAGLIYQNESGALNESFSDIFGAAIEFDALGYSNGDWLMGEDLGFVIRYMSNPNQGGDPDTYDGNFWYVGPNDNGGVHTNSGVQNFWFYLLTEGGTGTNDIGNQYNVTAVGVEDAGAIAYRNLVTYLTVSSQYSDARFYAIESAMDLFGPCSQQVISTGNAWYAVGVGSPYQATVDADFSSNSTGNCYAPYDIYFYDYSSNATSVIWDFGDGNTSTANNPVHTYTAPGDYTVSFNVNSSCGSDSTVAIDYIKIGPEAPCEVILPGTGQASSQNSCTGSIYDNGGPNANYTNDANSYVVINPTGAGSVTLTISDFDIEAGSGGSNCDYDYLEFFDGIGVGAPSLGRYCNNNLPPTTISSTSSAITVRFLSDGGVTNAGFKVDWECNEPTSAPEADFEANTTETCDGEVHFTDLSMNGAQEWLWDFGDGTSDTVQNPTHTYSSSGNYTVKLTASNGIGSDVITKQNYIIVSRPEAPIGENQEICPGETATLSASSDGEHRWFSDPFGTSPIYEGDHFTTPVIQTSTPYYVESIMAGASQSAGASGNGIGSGGFLNFNQSLYFDVFAPFILHSVKVYAATAGPRQIVVLNSSGVVIASKTVQIPFGQQTVELDFELGPGTDYQLGLSATSEINLYRNDSGTDYPYDLAGVLSITRSSAGTGPLDYYYYFYDWQVKEFCISERAEIIASTSICAGVEEVNKSGFDVFPNPAKNLITVKSINQSEGFSINIYDMRGQLVKSSAVESSDQSEVNVGELSRGVYLLRIKQNNRVQQTERIVLQ